ncbi:MAG: hypothetical protein ACOC71_09250 [Hyphomicrobiales bacterium]
MLLKVLQIFVRSICYVMITWYRFAPDGGGKSVRRSGQGQAKRGA